MIRLFTILYKLDFTRLPTARSIFEAVDKKFNAAKERCPVCGTKGCLSDHDTYGHDLVEYNDGRLADGHIAIRRFICKSCGKTAAILPDVFIPHKSYNILFILMVLKAYYFRKEPVAAVCGRYGISVSTLYLWKRRYLSHKRLHLGKLEKYLVGEDPHIAQPDNICFTELPCDFFRRFGVSFLQYKKATESGSG